VNNEILFSAEVVRVAGRRRADDELDPALSDRQQQILDFIEAYAERHRVSPTLREIGDAVGLEATSAVKHQVEQLQKKGYVTRRNRTPRSIVVKPRRLRSIELGLEEAPVDPGSGEPMVSMPLYESLAAGDPVDANPDAVDTIRLPRDMVGSGRVFAVRVKGNSMVDVDIFDGDCVVIRQQNDAVNGDIVAALTEDGGTVKTFLQTDAHVWLMPENPSYEPILGDGCQIMGKVVATLHSRRDG
jgi:repressor LexA